MLSWVCSFCGLEERGDNRLVAGAEAFICGGCARSCRDVFSNKATQEAGWALEESGVLCSFCRREAEGGRPVIHREGAYICTECVTDAVEISMKHEQVEEALRKRYQESIKKSGR